MCVSWYFPFVIGPPLPRRRTPFHANQVGGLADVVSSLAKAHQASGLLTEVGPSAGTKQQANQVARQVARQGRRSPSGAQPPPPLTAVQVILPKYDCIDYRSVHELRQTTEIEVRPSAVHPHPRSQYFSAPHALAI